MDDYDDVQNWLSLSEVNTKENWSVGGRKTCGADMGHCDGRRIINDDKIVCIYYIVNRSEFI